MDFHEIMENRKTRIFGSIYASYSTLQNLSKSFWYGQIWRFDADSSCFESLKHLSIQSYVYKNGFQDFGDIQFKFNEQLEIPYNMIMAKELTVTGSFRFANVFETAINLVATGKVDLSPMISKVYKTSLFLGYTKK